MRQDLQGYPLSLQSENRKGGVAEGGEEGKGADDATQAEYG